MSLGHGASIVRDGIRFQLDFANPKSYSGSGNTVYNINKTGNFTTFGSPIFSNGMMQFNGLNPGSHMYESSGLGNHGTGSFTYQFLVKPKSSTSVDSPNECRIYEQTGWPDTYHILQVFHNSGSPRFNFFGRDLSQTISFGVNSPNGSAILNKWYLLTCIIDRDVNKSILYLNDIRYENSFSAAMIGVGDNDPIRIPSSYAEANMDLSCVISYNRALADTEVKQNFEALRGRYGI